MLSLILGFLFGALTIIVAEVLLLRHFLNRLTKNPKKSSKDSSHDDLDPQQSLSFSYNKQGAIWIMEVEKVPKDILPKEQKSKKEITEVSPVKKYGKIKDQLLILTDSDGSQATISLADCTIVSVSASNLSTRKWAKRYPVKLEGRNTTVYNGSKILYIYLDTSWEKESWCKALRLASGDDKERVNWYAKLNKEFQTYLTSLNAGYPSLKKTSVAVSGEPTDRTSKFDSSSKVRVFLKKLAKKASKSGYEHKGLESSASVREDRKMGDKSRSIHDLLSATSSGKFPYIENVSNRLSDEDSVSSQARDHSHVNLDTNFDEKFGVDEGTLCCNLLISRLFFDAKRNINLKSAIQERIQRTLANMRTPSYIGAVTCTGLDLGSLPPNIHAMRVLPMDMNEVWAIEMDFEYSGGAILDVETRLEVREPDFQKDIVDRGLESSSAGEATSDLLEGFGYLENQLSVSAENVDGAEKRHEEDNKLDGSKLSKSTSWKSASISRWKAIVNSVANQVSQVPISLGIRIASVRGTLRLHIKPPPSDQLWFAFTSMPDIDFHLESSFGDHKITSGHVASLLANRFKASIRDTLVLPNCESVCVPWMLAEKNDWVPRKTAPFIWVKQEVASDSSALDVPNSQREEAPPRGEVSNTLENIQERTNIQEPRNEQIENLESSSKRRLSEASSFSSQSTSNSSTHDLRTPLLKKDESLDTDSASSRLDSPEGNQSLSESMTRERQFGSFAEDVNHKKTGRRARMMDLGKKMSEKLEEKRRHIEEKSRNIVEKMRGP